MDLAEGTKRDSGVIFHRIGISEEDNDSGFKGWKMRTLSIDLDFCYFAKIQFNQL